MHKNFSNKLYVLNECGEWKDYCTQCTKYVSSSFAMIINTLLDWFAAPQAACNDEYFLHPLKNDT